MFRSKTPEENGATIVPFSFLSQAEQINVVPSFIAIKIGGAGMGMDSSCATVSSYFCLWILSYSSTAIAADSRYRLI